jgi:hypothetical protein
MTSIRFFVVVGMTSGMLGCTGGQTGEIAMHACETPLGIVAHAEVHPEVGASADERIAALAPAPASLGWTDGTTTEVELDFESAAGFADGVQVLEGETCDPYLRAPTWVTVRTADGWLDERVLTEADLFADSVARFALDPYLDSLGGTFDSTAFAMGVDPTNARLLIQVDVDGATSTGSLSMTSGRDDGGDPVSVGNW